MSNVKNLKITSLKALFVASILTLSSIVSTHAGGDVEKGKKLFKDNCARCHNVTDKRLVGPGLQGVKGRWSSEDNLRAWIKNSAEYLKTGDAYATQLFNDYSGSPMPAFGALTDDDITNILAYIETPGTPGGGAPTDSTTTAGGGGKGEKGGMSKNTLTLVLIGAAVILLILARALSSVSKSMQNVTREKEGEPKLPEAKPFDLFTNLWSWFVNHKKISLFLGFIVFCWLFYKAFVGLMQIGVYTNYQPTQPIKFSHKLHVTQNGIDCKYCHSTADDSRHAGIPSSNVCMNCHKAVDNGPKYGKQEISKIYAAIGWNPDKKEYFKDYQNMPQDSVKKIFANWLSDTKGAYEEVEGQIQKPVAWVQVHNLPDHVFFSHQQHVVVGKVECQTCHGKVEEMEEVKQFAPLTMGWCINCHRQTTVQYADNGYYTRLHEYYKEHYGEYEMRHGDAFTVEKIGGLECSKCHY